jgi:hypothetical protein
VLRETKKYYFCEALLPFGLLLVKGLGLWLSVLSKSDFLLVVSIIAATISLVWLVVRIRDIVRALYFEQKCIEKMLASQNLKGLLGEEGGNRTGKSLDATITLYYKALSLEQRISRFTKLYRAKKLKMKLTPKEYLEYCELSETYEEMRRCPDLIVPLVTNVKLTARDGRTSSDLTGRYLLQLDKLPQPCAIGLDETRSKMIGDLFLDRDGAYNLTAMARFFNHYTGDDSLWVFMEQNSGRMFNGYRDSLCMIKNQKGVKVLLEPVRLLKKLEKLFAKLDAMEFVTYAFAMRVLNLYKRTKRIGVLQLNFTVFGNKDSSGETLSDGIMQEYIPCDAPVSYDNRFFRTSYLARNDDITLSRFRGNLLSESQVDDIIRLEEIDGKPAVTYRGEDIKALLAEKKAPSDALGTPTDDKGLILTHSPAVREYDPTGGW